MSADIQTHRGMRRFTLRELFVVITTIGILLALLLPFVHAARESARGMQCNSNLKQLAIAILNYEAVYRRLPTAMGGTKGSPDEMTSNLGRLSSLPALTPFLESSPFWNKVNSPCTYGGVNFPPMGPAPWIAIYDPWREQFPQFLCPATPFGDPDPTQLARTSYAFCIGDLAKDIHQPSVARGAVACGLYTKLDDVIDGTSCTILLGEIIPAVGGRAEGLVAIDLPETLFGNPSECMTIFKNKSRGRPIKTNFMKQRALRWTDGAAGYALFNTILPPNSGNCSIGGSEAVDGYYSAASFHKGGVNIAFVDGSVRWIGNGIDTAFTAPEPANATNVRGYPSIRSVWGYMGSAGGNDSVMFDE